MQSGLIPQAAQIRKQYLQVLALAWYSEVVSGLVTAVQQQESRPRYMSGKEETDQL